jgi:hypothetical protein
MVRSRKELNVVDEDEDDDDDDGDTTKIIFMNLMLIDKTTTMSK